MKQSLIFFIIFIVALGADIAVAPIGIFRIGPPLAALVLMGWYGVLPLSGRLYAAFAAGFILDSIHVFPSGTYLASFVLIAIAAEWLRRFFSNTASGAVWGLSTVLAISILWLIVPAIGDTLSYIA